MSRTGIGLVVVGVVLVVLGLVQHFAQLVAIAHVTTGLVVVGVIVAALGFWLGQRRDRSLVR